MPARDTNFSKYSFSWEMKTIQKGIRFMLRKGRFCNVERQKVKPGT